MDQKVFNAVDLHVHTPASSCYKNMNSDEEYISILKRYVKENVKLIAITDHNTIMGYKKILEIKERLKKYILELNEISNKSGIPLCDIKEFEEKYDLFEKITILPGVEFEVNPGLHILTIFNPDYEIDVIDKIIKDIGYDSESQGSENPGNINVDVLELFKILETSDAIVIGAHADSNKGIYKSTEGQYRAQIFRNERLNGIQYLNQKSADQMKSMLNNKEYKRDSPLSFIKASDFHGEFEDSLDVIYVDLEEITYKDLKNAFTTPEQSFSLTKNPEIKTIIKNVIELDNSLIIEKITQEEFDIKLASYLCALINNGYGNLVVGISENQFMNFLGVEYDEEELMIIIRNHLSHLDLESFDINFTTSKYRWGNKNIFILNIQNMTKKIFSIDNNNTYFLRDNKKVEKAGTQDIVSLTEERVITKVKKYMDKNNSRINRISQELSLLNELNACFDTLLKIDSYSLPLNKCVQIDFINDVNPVEIPFTTSIGMPKFNVIVPGDLPPRLEKSYLRYLPCGYYCDDLQGGNIFSGKSIIITLSGASYYVNDISNYRITNASNHKPCIRLTIEEAFADSLSYEVLIAWFKSSLFMFYTYANYGKNSIFKPDIFKNSPLIIDSKLDANGRIKAIVEDIIHNEVMFLEEVNRMCDFDCLKCKKSEEERENFHEDLDNYLSDFNDHIGIKQMEIDDIIFDLFKVPYETINTIEKYMKLNDFHVYSGEFDDSFINEDD